MTYVLIGLWLVGLVGIWLVFVGCYVAAMLLVREAFSSAPSLLARRVVDVVVDEPSPLDHQ